jgi:hypothetical protein
MRDADPFSNNPLPGFGGPAAPFPAHSPQSPVVGPATTDPRAATGRRIPSDPFSGGLSNPLLPVPNADTTVEDLRPRLGLLAAAVAIPAASALLLLLHGWYWNFIGWGLAIFGSLGLISWFTTVDLRDQSTNRYRENDTAVAVLRIAATVLGLVVAGCHAWQFATWAARLGVFA